MAKDRVRSVGTAFSTSEKLVRKHITLQEITTTYEKKMGLMDDTLAEDHAPDTSSSCHQGTKGVSLGSEPHASRHMAWRRVQVYLDCANF